MKNVYTAIQLLKYPNSDIQEQLLDYIESQLDSEEVTDLAMLLI